MAHDLAASVRVRLLNIAEAEQTDFNAVLVRYALERFLCWLGQSQQSMLDSFFCSLSEDGDWQRLVFDRGFAKARDRLAQRSSRIAIHDGFSKVFVKTAAHHVLGTLTPYPSEAHPDMSGLPS